jgi:hypothetical protein
MFLIVLGVIVIVIAMILMLKTYNVIDALGANVASLWDSFNTTLEGINSPENLTLLLLIAGVVMLIVGYLIRYGKKRP